MSQFTINLLFVGASFALYFGIAIWARAGSICKVWFAFLVPRADNRGA